MKANGVDDDHCKDSSEDLLFPDNEMEPRVQNYGLTSDHAIPANGDDSNRDIVIENLSGGDKPEELEEEAQSMEHTAITRDQK